MMSRQDSATPFTVMTGSRQPDQPHQEAEQDDAEHQRQRKADLARACGLRLGGMRDTSTERKMTLSMPSTISSAVNVSSAAQASALVRSSIMP